MRLRRGLRNARFDSCGERSGEPCSVGRRGVGPVEINGDRRAAGAPTERAMRDERRVADQAVVIDPTGPGGIAGFLEGQPDGTY